MNFLKGGLDGQVEKVIDQAADVAKEKISNLVGGGEKKDKKQEGAGEGIGDIAGGAINKLGSTCAADKVMSFGKNILG